MQCRQEVALLVRLQANSAVLLLALFKADLWQRADLVVRQSLSREDRADLQDPADAARQALVQREIFQGEPVEHSSKTTIKAAFQCECLAEHRSRGLLRTLSGMRC